MVGQLFSAFMRKSLMFRLVFLAGLIGILIGCGGGGDGVSGFSSVDDGTVGDGDIPPALNQVPMAMISSPSGTSFNEGENIVFSGTGTDAEDGQLTDDALVWTSSIDGPIGTGSTLITSTLTPGDHGITLSATDSDGATQTTDPVSVIVEPTRFLKMGFQTTGVIDAFYAFDGDHDTAATITTAETAFIHFKAYIGGADTFHFRIKAGVSTIGSSLAIEGLTAEDAWQPVSDIDLDDDKSITVKVTDAQIYTDADGYINLRALLANGQRPDTVLIYEIWRFDPVYSGGQTTGVANPELAFDGDPLTSATIIEPSSSIDRLNYLHFKVYVDAGLSKDFAFNILLNDIGPSQYLVIEVENLISEDWLSVKDLNLNTNETRTVFIQDVQNYMDADGYINLRAYWIGFKTPMTTVEVFEILRIDPFVVGPETSSGPFTIENPEGAMDGDLYSFATIYYSWGENDHKDFLHVQNYVGDASLVKISIATALSSPPDAELIVDGEAKPENWSVLERISLSDLRTTTIELPNVRGYVDANGHLSLRLRFISDSISHDAIIYEIWREGV